MLAKDPFRTLKPMLRVTALTSLLLIMTTPAWADTCEAPDNGTGTVDLPAQCPYETPPADPMLIIDGLPPAHDPGDGRDLPRV